MAVWWARGREKEEEGVKVGVVNTGVCEMEDQWIKYVNLHSYFFLGKLASDRLDL